MDRLHPKFLSTGRIPPGAVCAGENVNGEKLYIGCWKTYNYDTHPWLQEKLYIPGIITPSQHSLTFCDYNAIEKELPLVTITAKRAKFDVLTSECKALDFAYWESSENFLYWEPSEKFTLNRSLPRNVVIMDTVVRSHVPCLLFVAQVPPTVIHDGKVIGHYDKALFPADFSGPLVGAGQAWLDLNCRETKLAMDYNDYRNYRYNSYNVSVFYDGKIYEASNFSILCAYAIPNFNFPKVNWKPVYNGQLPPNALPACVGPTGEVLYVASCDSWSYNTGPYYSSEHPCGMIPGYIIPAEKCVHICCNGMEHCYTSGYKVLTIEESHAVEWCTYSGGEVPSTAISCGSSVEYDEEEYIYIGRTVTNGCLKYQEDQDIERAPNTQLIGKIHCSHGCLYVPWDGKQVAYYDYDVLVSKMEPKNLQELCRNAIITATLALPDRVDKLSLPTHLKDYCNLHNYCDVEEHQLYSCKIYNIILKRT